MSDKLILASASPRRSELLDAGGYDFEVRLSKAEEIQEGEPSHVVTVNARSKAQAVSALYPGRTVLGADTVVALDGVIYGKPADRADAFRMLRSLSGKTHIVCTGVCVTDGIRCDIRSDISYVTFRPLTDREIDDYIETGEPMDKAGAYAIQGGAGKFVSELKGSMSNVIGLPMETAGEMLADFGLFPKEHYETDG